MTKDKGSGALLTNSATLVVVVVALIVVDLGGLGLPSLMILR